MNEIIQSIYKNIYEGDYINIAANVQSAIEAGMPPSNILEKGMVAAMSEVGRLFEVGEYYVPEMLISARAMQTGLAILKPHLIEANVKPSGKVAIGTVQGDLHDIGKNLVSMMLEGAGFEIVDLGTDVSPQAFIAAIKEHHPEIVGMSALLTTTMTGMQTAIDEFKKAGVRDQVKIIVGGAPLNDNFARQIGADGYSPDASASVRLAKSLIGK